MKLINQWLALYINAKDFSLRFELTIIVSL